MKWTIGMPSYQNYSEVYFTVQSLRMHHDMTDKEIVVVDNFGDPLLERFCKEKGGSVVKYVKCADVAGVSVAKNKIFEVAAGEFVLCIDSHILLARGVFDREPTGDDFIQGPCAHNDMTRYAFEWLPKWRANMWGIWGDYIPESALPAEPVEIWGMGAGFFACRRASWLGFNSAFRGFGGETGYIQEKYRKAGRRVMCYPNMKWVHFFASFSHCSSGPLQGRSLPYDVKIVDRVRNYIIGFEEIGLDTLPIKNHFGAEMFNQARSMI